MKDVVYTNNLIEYCVYSIEYFLGQPANTEVTRYQENILIQNNIMRYAGFGFGIQRRDATTPAHIKGWSYVNKAKRFKIHDNIFDRAAYRIIHAVSLDDESRPEMYNNTYIQYDGNVIGKVGSNFEKEPDDIIADCDASANIATSFGEKNSKVYIIK